MLEKRNRILLRKMGQVQTLSSFTCEANGETSESAEDEWRSVVEQLYLSVLQRGY